MLKLSGSIVALVTPMEGGRVDEVQLKRLVRWHISSGTSGIVVLGTTGENATLTPEEQELVCRAAVEEAAGRVPIIAGSGTNNTAHMLERSLRYQELGADALLLIAPYYNKANEEGMYRHFAEVAGKVELPCLLYNVPGRTGCSIPVGVVERLSRLENIVGIKEASGDLGYASRVARLIGPGFCMLSGNDDVVLPMLALGACGVISVFANILPDKAQAMVQRFLGGDIAGCRKLQLEYLELINALFLEVNPIPVKTAMELMGLCSGELRLPLCEMSAPQKQKLRRAMEEVGAL